MRRVVASSLLLVAIGSGLTLVMTSAWQLWLLWGFAVGVGTGSLALVFGAIVANRWFVKHRGVVIGVFSAASSTGQLVFLPAIAQLADGPGWRWAAGRGRRSRACLVPLVLVASCATSPPTSASRRTARGRTGRRRPPVTAPTALPASRSTPCGRARGRARSGSCS